MNKQEIEEGVSLRQAQLLGASVAHFRALVARHPENVSARLHLSSSLRLIGAYEESLALLDAVLEGDPANRAALVGKVDTLAHRQQFAEALTVLDTAQVLYPDELDLRLKQGVVLRLAQRLEDSVAYFRDLVAQHPEHVDARLQLALSLRLVGAYDESLALVDAVLAADPRNRAALVARIDTLAHRQQVTEALENLHEAQVRHPGGLDLEVRQGVLFRQAQQLDASVAHLRRLAAQHPEHVDARLQLATSLRFVGAHEESLALFDAVLEMEPRHRGALIGKVDTLAHRQQFAEALDALGAVQALFPDHLDLKVKQGNLLRQAQRLDESVAHLRAFVALHPKHVDASLQLAISLSLAGAHDESLAMLNAMLAAMPGHRTALVHLANLHLSDNEPEKALATNTLAAGRFPGDIQLAQQRVGILARMSDQEDVVEQLQILFRQAPQSAVVARGLIDRLVRDWRYDDAMEVFRRFVDTPVLDNNGRQQQILLCLQYGELSRALDLSRRWMDAYPDSFDAKLSFFTVCCELPKAPVDLSTLEGELLRRCKGSSALAIARALRRQYELDFGGVTAVLVGFLRENRSAVDVLSYLFQFLLGIDKLDSCLDLLRGFPELRAPHVFDLANKLLMEGRRVEADALLPRLEDAVEAASAAHERVQLLRRMCALQILRNDGPALNKAVETALSLKNLGGANRHYFTCIKHGLLGRNDGDGVPETVSLVPSGLSLKALVQGKGYRAMSIKPEALAIARQISAPSDGLYEDWLKRALKGATVRHTVAHCYAERPEKLDDLEGLVDFPDSAVLERYAGRSEPFLVTGTHQGANAVVWRLLQSFPNLRVVAVHKQLRRDHPTARAALPLGPDPASTRALINALRAGAPVAAALDQVFLSGWSTGENAHLVNTVELQLFDFPPLRVPNLLPKLAWKMNLPSYWVQSYLDRGRVRIELVRLPDADYAIDREAWIGQWVAAYGKQVEAVLRSTPENLCIEAGLIREIARTCGTRRLAAR
ncbi:tetratricopeptide repeat protein [Stappia indica]|uniref:tetratricopeptide repeat protein n=1 Tax=Stappia indica TaxID=538381 RepID=UPI001CD38272|nr:tetratricopeptide repeat protein [Stappia indica]MCA1296964.1 tetratricopeptide repeat protein [Stappia indica]